MQQIELAIHLSTRIQKSKLKFKDNKTEVMLFRSKDKCRDEWPAILRTENRDMKYVECVRNLGVLLDSRMHMEEAYQQFAPDMLNVHA